MALIDNIFAYWKLDEASGNATDSSPSGFTLTNEGTMTYGAGLIGNCAISASLKYLDTTTSLAITGATAMSVSFWWKGTTTSFQYMVTRRGSAGGDHINYQILFDFRAASKAEFLFTAAAATYHRWKTTADASTFGIQDGNWHHIAIVYTFGTGASMTWYIDNVSKGGSWTTGDGNSTHTDGTESFAISDDAAFPGSSGGFGSFDEFGIWSGKALTASEVSQLYNAGAGLTYPFVTSRSNLTLLGVS